MKEAMCIQSTPTDSRFNRDSGYELPDCWIALNRKLKGGALVGAPRASAGVAGNSVARKLCRGDTIS